MKYVMRTRLVLIAAMLGMLALAATALAQNAPQCVVSGSPPAGWGFNSIGYIEIASGSSCLFTVNINGEILSSSVSQNSRKRHAATARFIFVLVHIAGWLQGPRYFLHSGDRQESNEFWRVSNNDQCNPTIALTFDR